MRHAQSKANVAGIIVSSIDNDRLGDYGLTGLGRQQAHAAAASARLPIDTLICSSDFARAMQTAQVVRAYLGAPPVVITPALRERYFGTWECKTTSNYDRVWAADAAHRTDDDVEPVAAVLDRMTAFIAGLERQHAGRDILLVSHGDPLQILLAGLQCLDPTAHRSVPPLPPAEIRRVSTRLLSRRTSRV
jgi:glucosyl-3-phosphoglycerate phosphatase